MGVDIEIYLPAYVRIRDVADVVGRLAGLPIEPLGGGGGFWHVKGAQAVASSVPTMALIELKGRCFIDGETHHEMNYHFECSKPEWDGEPIKGEFRHLSARSTPWWCAIGKRLVEIFGGIVDYQDCDSNYTDIVNFKGFVKNRALFTAHDDPEWSKLKNLIRDVQPITYVDLAEADKVAAYHPKREE